MRAMVDNVKKFEAQHGIIEEADQNYPPMNFNTPKAQA